MDASLLDAMNAQLHISQHSTSENVSAAAEHSNILLTSIKQKPEPPCTSTTNPQTTLVTLPGEILDMILKLLLVSPRSLPIPTPTSLFFGEFRLRLSAQVLHTCQRLYQHGHRLLYGHNAFDVEPYIHPFLSTWRMVPPCQSEGPTASKTLKFSTHCPIRPSNLAMITHLEIDMAKLEYSGTSVERNNTSVIVRQALKVLRHLHDLDSIRIIIEGRYEHNRTFIDSRLVMPTEYGPYRQRHIESGGADSGAAAKVAVNNAKADWAIVRWCAILIAETFREHAPLYRYMYHATRGLGADSVGGQPELSLIMHRNPKDTRSRMLNEQRGIKYVGKLEVDSEGKCVKHTLVNEML